jgi:hypothetical protein
VTHTPPAQQKKGYWQRPNNYIRIATLIFVGLYTVFSYCLITITRSNNVAAQRAYVFLRDISIQRGNGSGFDVIPLWENTGNTQTKNMTGYLSRHFGPGDLQTDFTYIDIPSDRKSVPLLLGPKAVSTVTFDVIDKRCFAQFNSRDIFNKFYIWGWVRYNDIMTEQRYITRFCWDVSEIIFSQDGSTARFSHALCGEGNCTEEDENCDEPRSRITVTIPNITCKPSSQ